MQSLATSSADGTLRIWSVSNGAYMRTLNAGSNSVSANSGGRFRPAISSNWRRAVLPDPNGHPVLFDVEGGRTLFRLPGEFTDAKSIVFNRDGRRLIRNNFWGGSSLWDTESGTQLRGLGESVALFSPDGQRVLAGLELLGSSTAQSTGITIKAPKLPQLAEFSPNGQRVATADDESTSVHIWDTADGHQIATLTGHTDLITLCRFSADGKRLLTVSRDNTVRVSLAETAEEIAVFRWDKAVQAEGTGFTPGSDRLLIAFEDSTAEIAWIGHSVKEVLSLSRSVSPSELSRDQEQRYFLSLDLEKQRGTTP
jgi:WD40 repeat protein